MRRKPLKQLVPPKMAKGLKVLGTRKVQRVVKVTQRVPAVQYHAYGKAKAKKRK